MIQGTLRLVRPVRVEIPFFRTPAPVREPLPTSRNRLVAQIQEINPSAGREFLERFGDSALREYLEHLQTGVEPRGTGWVRREGRPAIVHRNSRPE